ncbi:MAG: hypothetical protein IC227_10590 [Enterococcus lacertideformus]|uniref:Uncharacterized protein n=1 Tax=Enterococcus lacertideformus TaxID=2771493 RepID=A0A931FD95_9ENTE|nr:hypothetical protein [Enterococcus lacertideformus]
MKKEKKNVKVRKLLTIFACAITLFVMITSGIVKESVFTQDLLINQIKKIKYSELVLNETNQSFREENIEKNEFVEVIATSISPVYVDQALQAFIHYTYDDRESDDLHTISDLDEEITHAIDSYAKKHQVTINKEEENKIEKMKFDYIYLLQKNVGDRYLTIFIENSLSAKSIVYVVFYLTFAVLLFLLLYLFILIRKITDFLLWYVPLISGISGSMFLFLTGLLYANNFLKNIAFQSQAILQLMTNYSQEILSRFLFIGVALVIGGMVVFLIGKPIRRKVHKRAANRKKILETPN